MRRFKMKFFSIRLSDRLSVSEILLSLTPKDRELFHISNFPRSLLQDDSYLTGMNEFFYNIYLIPPLSSNINNGVQELDTQLPQIPVDGQADRGAKESTPGHHPPRCCQRMMPTLSLRIQNLHMCLVIPLQHLWKLQQAVCLGEVWQSWMAPNILRRKKYQCLHLYRLKLLRFLEVKSLRCLDD